MEALDDDIDDLVEIDLCVIETNFKAGILPISPKKKRENDSQIYVHDDGVETSLDEVIDMMGFGKFQVIT